MDKEKFNKLVRYSEDLKHRLSAPTPEKHAAHPAAYKLFLERELVAVTKKIDGLKLTGGGK